MRGLHRVLNMPGHDLIMPQYAWIYLNNPEYACIYQNKQSSEYARIINVSNAVRSVRSLYKLLSSYRDRNVFRTLSNILRWSVLQKKQQLSAGAQLKTFQDRGSFVEIGHFDKHFVKNTKKTPQGNILEFYLI